jgi:molecular chaperone HtpG
LVQKDEKQESVLSEKEQEKIKNLFEAKINGTGINISLQPLTPEDQPVVITKPEFMRRMKEMQALQGMQSDAFPDSYNVVVNTNHALIADKLLKMRSEEKKEDFVKHLYNLALLNQGMLKGSDLTNFINRSIDYLK